MTGDRSTRAITVVVPVFGDENSLRDCVESLTATVDQSRHTVLFVNDVGPDADRIEGYLLEVVARHTSFRYERNDRNLGFVATCNRAANELDTTDNDILFLNSDTITTPGFLDELSAVLHASPTHGAVCPRSNNATIASLPFGRREPAAPRSIERTATVHAALARELPRYTVSPVAMGFCILIRRELIREFGLFDPVFSPGYGEENDFCLRIARHGFVSLIAHHALVFHRGGRSFGGLRREVLRARHESVLRRRHPGYARQVTSYLGRDRDPVDVFADALVPSQRALQALIDLGDVTSLDQGIIDLIAAADRAAGGNVGITVLAHPRLRRRITRRFSAVTTIGFTPLDRVWDVAVAYSEHVSFAATARLNRCAPRWVLVGDRASEARRFADLNLDRAAAPSRLLAEIGDWCVLPVDLAALRSRWSTVTRDPRHADELVPRRSRGMRWATRAAHTAPGLVAVARAVTRAVTRPWRPAR